jgi:phage-related protein
MAILFRKVAASLMIALEDRTVIGEDIKDVEFSRPMEHGRMVLLHALSRSGFVKKSQKTPQGDLDLALKRMRGTTV